MEVVLVKWGCCLQEFLMGKTFGFINEIDIDTLGNSKPKFTDMKTRRWVQQQTGSPSVKHARSSRQDQAYITGLHIFASLLRACPGMLRDYC